MKLSRVLVALVASTLLMQCFILYRMFHGNVSQSRQTPNPVMDAPKGSTLDISGLPIEGNEGRVILVEFSDYECPFCARHVSSVALDIENKFILTGKIRHVFVNNPLPGHSRARPLASAAICAGSQNYYWEMNRALFDKKPKEQSEIVELARVLKLDTEEFEKCLQKNPEGEQRIEMDLKTAKELNLTSTPTFAIGVLDSNGMVSLKKIVIGAQPFSVFDQAIITSLTSNQKGD